MGLFDFLRPKPRQTGPVRSGSGISMEDAVVINAPSYSMGILEEYAFVQQQCGRKGEDWNLEFQALIKGHGGKPYDLFRVKLKDGTLREFYFDISSFYGKF